MDFSLLYRNRDFRFLYIGQFVSFMGTMITSVALPYQIYHETHSTLMVGLVSLFQLLPLLFTALLGGVLADRHHRKLLLILTESLLALGCFVLAFNASLEKSHIWLIFVTSVLMSGINGLHRPALESMVQQIVTKEDYAAVASLTTFKYSLCMIVGPAIGGLIIAQFGLLNTFLIDAVSFLVSLVALLSMRHIPKAVGVLEESMWQSLKGGFKYALSRQELIGTYLVDFVAMIFAVPTALFPAIAQHFGGVKTLGMLYAAPAVGALIVSLFGSYAKKIKYHGRAIVFAASLWGLCILFFGFTTNLYSALCFLALSGAFDGVSGMFRSMMWNETIPNELRGRLSGIEMISYLSGPRMGDAEVGFVAAMFGVATAIISGGILCVVGVGVCSYILPKFWNYRSDHKSLLDSRRLDEIQDY